MDSRNSHLDLIDLISERHIQLRKLIEERWNERNDIYISNSEWHILSRIYLFEPSTIASISKQVDITRQATHKLIKSLKEKGLVEIYNQPNNKKEKAIKLSQSGKQCCESYTALKTEINTAIETELGADQLNMLKNILKEDWGL